MGSVYMLTSPSGKRYVGMTVRSDVNIRWSQHRRPTSDRPLYRAIRKYGWDQFSKAVLLESDSKAELIEAERRFIAEYGCMAPSGYNCTHGGEGTSGVKKSRQSIEAGASKLRGRKHSEDTKQKMRYAWLTRDRSGPMAGKKHSQETLDKMRFARKGRELTVREIEGHKRGAQKRVGREVSQETRDKIRAASLSQSDEVKAKIAEGMRRVWAERKSGGSR